MHRRPVPVEWIGARFDPTSDALAALGVLWEHLGLGVADAEVQPRRPGGMVPSS